MKERLLLLLISWVGEKKGKLQGTGKSVYTYLYNTLNMMEEIATYA